MKFPGQIRSTLNHLNSASRKIEQSTISLNIFMDSILKGRGDWFLSWRIWPVIYSDLVQTSGKYLKIKFKCKLIWPVKLTRSWFQYPMISHSGNYQTIMNPSHLLANSMKRTLNHVEQGTERFSQDMEALKSNFLFRGYFKKLAQTGHLQTEK